MSKFFITVGIDWQTDLDETLRSMGASVISVPTNIKDTTYSVVAELEGDYDERSLQWALYWLLEVEPEVVEVS